MELDTAVRYNLQVMVVISLNGGWSADPKQIKPGSNLGYTRFDKIAEALGCHGEYVEKPSDVQPALQRGAAAVEQGKPPLVNVVPDSRAQTTKFSPYST